MVAITEKKKEILDLDENTFETVGMKLIKIAYGKRRDIKFYHKYMHVPKIQTLFYDSNIIN